MDAYRLSCTVFAQILHRIRTQLQIKHKELFWGLNFAVRLKCKYTDPFQLSALFQVFFFTSLFSVFSFQSLGRNCCRV